MADHSDPSSPLEIAVLGAGRVTREVHLRVLSGIPGLTVKVIADPDETTLRLASRRFPRARLCSDWNDALDLPCDAVLVALPSGLHEPAALNALERGRHVYLEKPPALDEDGARRIAAAAVVNKALCQVGFHLRFDPRVVAIKDRVQSGGLGNLLRIQTFFNIPLGDMPAWKMSPPAGGALMDLAIHHFDIVRFLTNTQPTVLESSVSNHPFYEASAQVVLDIGEGARAEISCTLDGPPAHWITVTGTRGTMALDRYRDWHPRSSQNPSPSGPGNVLERIRTGPSALLYALSKVAAPWSDPAYLAAWRHFVVNVKRVNAGIPSLPGCGATATDGAEALRLVCEARCKAILP